MRNARSGREPDEILEPRELGPFLSPNGLILEIPRPLTSGPPRPEPSERWTLGPERREASSTEGPSTDASTEPGPATVRDGP